MEELEFDPHARVEMARDSVSKDEVYTVVGDADTVCERDDGRARYERVMEDGRRLVVIVEDASRTVRTVWWDKRSSSMRRGRRQR